MRWKIRYKAMLLLAVVTAAALLIAILSAPAPVKEVTIYGQVTDERGGPLPNAMVEYGDPEEGGPCRSLTDLEGHYSMVITIGDDHVVQAWSYPGHWARYVDLPSTDQSRIEVDIMLPSAGTVQVPVGALALVSTLNGSTACDIYAELTTDLRDDIDLAGGHQANYAPGQNVHYDLAHGSTNGSLSYLTVRMSLYGTIGPDDELVSCNLQDPMVLMADLDKDYLDLEDVMGDVTTYQLDQGESLTLSVWPEANMTYPGQLSPTSNITVGDSTMEMPESCTLVVGDGSRTFAHVTLTPLTAGTHTYYAYVEDGGILHVWEKDDRG